MTNRVKRILLIAAILIAIFVIYSYVYSPLQEQSQQLSDELAELQDTASQQAYLIETLPQLREKLEEVSTTVKGMASRYYGVLDQEQYVYKMNDMFKKSGISATSIAYNQEKIISQSTESAEAENENTPQIGGASPYTVAFTGTYAQLLKLLDYMDSNGQRIICNRITLQQANNTETGAESLNCSTEIQFYYLLDLPEYTMNSITDSFEKKPLSNSGQKSPFTSVN